MASELVNLPEDRDTLKAMVRSLALERDREKQRAEELHRRAEESKQQTEELRVEMLRLQLELERFRKWYYGPRADRLASGGEVAQMLLAFAEEVDRKPVHPDDLPPAPEAADEPRRLRRRAGRRNLAHFENLPVTTHVYELSVEERACPCCGSQRREMGADESWQIEYYPGRFERIHHVRRKYACPACERNGSGARIEAAAKPEAPVDKGLAGPGLLAYIVTSKFCDYLPLYRLGDTFERQGVLDLAGHAIDLVRRCGGLSRASLRADGRTRACFARGGHRRHGDADAGQRQDSQRAHVGLRGR